MESMSCSLCGEGFGKPRFMLLQRGICMHKVMQAIKVTISQPYLHDIHEQPPRASYLAMVLATCTLHAMMFPRRSAIRSQYRLQCIKHKQV
jgi:hypothetical protein